jgi:NAD(P)-dependent dehydrogenase (short-subunit alcohol dehydrogenase family)
MRYLAVELAPKCIRINAIAPAIVETDDVRTLFGSEAQIWCAMTLVTTRPVAELQLPITPA